METKSAELGGAILISAGAFQFTSLKYACLQHCRSPFAFFMASWRPGCTGALSMGFRHGLYCVGCCWALMAVMFVGGVMNPLWLVALAVFVLIEKFAPSGCRIGQVTGALLVAAGVYMITLY
jgi:predicted metal-binding membrane protein